MMETAIDDIVAEFGPCCTEARGDKKAAVTIWHLHGD
jgi:hypothetical protein